MRTNSSARKGTIFAAGHAAASGAARTRASQASNGIVGREEVGEERDKPKDQTGPLFPERVVEIADDSQDKGHTRKEV